MSLDQRLCPGVGGSKCGAFMSPQFRDLHPTCARCSHKKCTSDITCDICKDWSVAQWEAFLKKLSCSECRKSRPSSSALPHASPPIPPSASASSEAGHRSPSPPPSSLPSEGRGRVGKTEGVSRVGSRSVSSPPLALWRGGSWLLGASDSAASSPSGVGVAWSSRSQESAVLARCALPSVNSSASVERDHGLGLFRGPLLLSLFPGLPVT